MNTKDVLSSLACSPKTSANRNESYLDKTEIEIIKEDLSKLKQDFEEHKEMANFDWKTYNQVQNHKFQTEIFFKRCIDFCKDLQTEMDELDNKLCSMMIDNESDTDTRLLSMEKKIKGIERGKILDLVQAGAVAAIVSGLVILISNRRK